MQTKNCAIGVDVGTGSVRAGLVEIATGKIICVHTVPITVFETQAKNETHYEQSSEQIWDACCQVIRLCAKEAENVVGIGFDATCSLVAWNGKEHKPVSISVSGEAQRNVILWACHRAIEQSQRINATKHKVLQYVGGIISPEMETPKLVWIKENLPLVWNNKDVLYFDLPDYLVYRATNCSHIRSQCTKVCKWTYLAHEQAFQDDFFQLIGLGDFVTSKYEQIGTQILPVGTPVAKGVTEQAALLLHVPANTPVGVAMIDAHAGGIGIIGASLNSIVPSVKDICSRLVIVSGTSACHMSMTEKPVFVHGIWGPFYNAMVPGFWCNEAGQSAVGKLIDHIIASHAFASQLDQLAKQQSKSIYEILNDTLNTMAADSNCSVATLTKNIHVFPDFHGNRSPRADPTLTGMIVGLTIENSLSNLALLYLATVQGIAYGCRHIMEELNKQRTLDGESQINTIFMCGGLIKNKTYIQQHVDICACDIILPREADTMIIGSACLGAMAHQMTSDSTLDAKTSMMSIMSTMNVAGDTYAYQKQNQQVADYHQAKFKIFKLMYEHQMMYREIMK